MMGVDIQVRDCQFSGPIDNFVCCQWTPPNTNHRNEHRSCSLPTKWSCMCMHPQAHSLPWALLGPPGHLGDT